MLFLLLMFELDAKLTNPFRLAVLVMLAPWDIPVAHLLASHICSRLTFNRVVTRLLAFHVWLYWPFTSNSMINAPDGWTFNRSPGGTSTVVSSDAMIAGPINVAPLPS